ncbi:membrane-spanning 4-domains subfamily A member 15 isoform X3 [Caretta caretta]|uniref:membrane-spanning 4-domains subfamily A member 15 isoform X3 n=1 Tax=Caretta caretta TaxID=8467 RepID=UPI002094A358|nr:membrane-spanning 4-domains subfamily A member 15-like isoform X4 [Caretta caretta]
MATTMTASSASPITIINSFITQPHMASAAISAKPQPLEKFYKGEPLALGVVSHWPKDARGWNSRRRLPPALRINWITQILVGAVQVAVGMVMAMVNSYLWILALTVHVPLWSGLLYIISGSISVAAAKNPKIPLKVTMACIMVLFLFTFLEFCVSISTAAFGCKTVCRDSYSQVSVVIYQNMVPPGDPTTATNTHTDAVACTPPPYKGLATA